MQNFTGHFFNKVLNESFDSSQEFYLTDDTDETDTYATFDIDGKQYIMCLLRSKSPGVYEVKLGRFSGGKKPRWWSFHNPSHILPAFSTLFEFLDQSHKNKGSVIQGTFVRVRGKRETANRMERFIGRLLKRKFNKNFSFVDVAQPPEDEIVEYSFWFSVMVIRKGVSPQSVFNKAHFKKYDFDTVGGKTVIPAKAVDDLKPKKKEKKTLTTEPSKKYSYRDIEINVVTGTDELLQKLETAKIDDSKPETKETKKITSIDATNLSSIEEMALFGAIFPSLYKKIKLKGFDEEKLNWTDMKYVFDQAAKKSKVVDQALRDLGIRHVENEKVKKEVINFLMDLESLDVELGSSVDLQKEKYEEILKDIDKPAQTNSLIVEKLDFDQSLLVSGLPYQKIDDIQAGGYVWESEENDPIKSADYMSTDLGYREKVANVTNFNLVYSYTGTAHSTYNNATRRLADDHFENKGFISTEDQEKITKGSIHRMYKCFDKIEPLPFPMWVFRGSNIPFLLKDMIKPGENFVDPGFLSTSLNHRISFGSDMRMRIFLPKGTKTIPVLTNSKHDPEKEIILPPMSVIKIIEVAKGPEKYAKLFVTGVYMGSAFESFRKELTDKYKDGKKVVTEEIMRKILMSEEDEKKYDPEEKFGGKYDPELAKKISDNLKKIAASKKK